MNLNDKIPFERVSVMDMGIENLRRLVKESRLKKPMDIEILRELLKESMLKKAIAIEQGLPSSRLGELRLFDREDYNDVDSWDDETIVDIASRVYLGPDMTDTDVCFHCLAFWDRKYVTPSCGACSYMKRHGKCGSVDEEDNYSRILKAIGKQSIAHYLTDDDEGSCPEIDEYISSLHDIQNAYMQYMEEEGNG